MEFVKAAAIVRNLADGLDPVTGTPLPAAHVIHSPDAIRALFTACEALDHLARKHDRKVSLPDNTGKAWPPDEDARLLHEFESAIDFDEIAKAHSRTRGSITARLEKLGRLQPRSFAARASH